MPAHPILHQDPSAEAEHRATVAAGFVRGLLSGAVARGVDPAPLLDAAGLDARHLADETRTPIGAYAALYNGIVRALGDEGFGLFSAPLRPGAFEFLCRSSIGAATLGEALDRAARFLAVVLPDLSVGVRVEGGVASVQIAERQRLRPRAADPRRVFAFEWLLRLLHGLACWLAGRALTLEAVAFPYPRPAHAADYARVYTERSTFDAGSLVARLDAHLLALPVRRGEADLAAFLDGAPGKIAMLYRRDREVASAVRTVLASDLAAVPGLDAVAATLRLSSRTLHRRLADEGTSFRVLRDALRRERALHLVERSGKGVAEIAAELGYSEPSAFFRAFVGWTGVAPTAYRKTLQAGTNRTARSP
jgi:AraC-like DNA-binding protein